MSNVYFIGTSSSRIKIGKADNVNKRLKELQTASSEHLKIVGTIRCFDSENAHSVEKMLHSMLAHRRVRGEWFDLHARTAKSIIESFKDVKFTFDTCVKQIETPNFTKVGNGKMNRHGIQSIDFLQEVMSMTKAEQLVISTIKDLIPYDSDTGEVYIQLSKLLTKTNTVVFRKGYKLLKDKNLVRRTKQSHYMINPAALVPLNFEKAHALWNASEGV